MTSQGGRTRDPRSGKAWFARYGVGYGFVPVTWQGWVVTAVVIIAVVVVILSISHVF